MKRIEMSDGMVYATNDSGHGAFMRRWNEGTYRQMRGIYQTPVFRSVDQFRRWLRDYCMVVGCRIIDSYGWD